jgi:hypothetical protein
MWEHKVVSKKCYRRRWCSITKKCYRQRCSLMASFWVQNDVCLGLVLVTLQAAQGPTVRVLRPTTHVIRGTGRSTYMNSLSVEECWRRSRNGSCCLDGSEQERCIASCFRNKIIPTHVETWICDLQLPVANNKSSIRIFTFTGKSQILWFATGF